MYIQAYKKFTSHSVAYCKVGKDITQKLYEKKIIDVFLLFINDKNYKLQLIEKKRKTELILSWHMNHLSLMLEKKICNHSC
jgi:hypothetical protein